MVIDNSTRLTEESVSRAAHSGDRTLYGRCEEGASMRVIKFLWFHLIMSLTGWLPDLKLCMRVRGFLVRPAFKACGRNFQVGRRVTVNFTNCVEIGRDVYIATGCWLHGWGGIVIEDEVQLGPYVVLVTGDHGLKEGSYRSGPSVRSAMFLGLTLGRRGAIRRPPGPPTL